MKTPLLALILAAGACAGSCSSTPDLPALPPRAPGPAPTIRIGPGDELELRFFYTPELDSSQLVRADGRISAPLVGEIDAAGATPGELETRLVELYGEHLKKPSIAVVLRASLNRRVWVGGYVMSPGVLELPGELSVLEAILQSGGLNLSEAEPSNVVVIRNAGARRSAFLVDLEAAWRNETSDRFLLQPGDIVHVPQSTIARVDQWVDQHINKVIPRTGLRYTSAIGSNAALTVGSQN